MIKQIVKDTTFLSQKAQPATPADANVIVDLMDTLIANQEHCVGLAANMIGVNKRIIVIQMGPIIVPMINPIITEKEQPYQTSEACLSLEGVRPTTRYRQITVRFANQNFEAQEQTFTGFVAQIIQHEVDHCAGILI